LIGDPTIRIGALALSLVLHGIWFVQAGGESGVQQPLATPPQTTVTRMNFTAPQREVVKQEVQPVQEKVVAKKEKAKPVKKVVPKVEPQPEAPQEEQLLSMPTTAATAPMLDEGLIEQERQRYLAEVMAHIERFKRYPKTARRRGVTGELHVRFMLMPDGSVKGLIVRNGPEVLIAAARESVEKAVPMPTPPKKVHCPMECEFRIRFNLNAS